MGTEEWVNATHRADGNSDVPAGGDDGGRAGGGGARERVCATDGADDNSDALAAVFRIILRVGERDCEERCSTRQRKRR